SRREARERPERPGPTAPRPARVDRRLVRAPRHPGPPVDRVPGRAPRAGRILGRGYRPRLCPRDVTRGFPSTTGRGKSTGARMTAEPPAGKPRAARTLREDAVNLPNLLTIGRVVAIPFLVWLLDTPTPVRGYWAGIVFTAAAITDMLDGYLARKLNVVS